MKKGMSNKRYRQTEEAILEVLLKSKEIPTVQGLTRRAKISRSTLYRHHRAIPGIIPDYEKEILRDYKKLIKKLFKQKTNLKNIYLRTLFFILQHKRMFKILFKYEGGRIIEKMFFELNSLIIETAYLPKNSEKIFKIYIKEVAGIIETWSEKNFSETEISKIQKEIIYLTETIRPRLGQIRE